MSTSIQLVFDASNPDQEARFWAEAPAAEAYLVVPPE